MTDHRNASPAASQTPSQAPLKGPSVRVLLVVLAALLGGVVIGALVDWRALMSRSSSDTTQEQGVDAHAHDHAGGIAPPAQKTDVAKTQLYTCSMHPDVLEDEPGLCPICRMDLVPVAAGESADGAVEIDPVVSQNIGVRVEPVRSGSIARTVRAVGIVAPDDARVRDISLKVAGWIETMHVAREGDMVDAGQPLLEIYSPALYAAQGEFLAALRAAASSAAAASQTTRELTLDARQQLTLLGMNEAQIDALALQVQAERTTTLRSPFEGQVIAKRVNEGAYAQPGETLLRIVDLSRVWMIVAVYEQDLPFVRVGQRAILTLPALPGRPFEGVVELIYPYVDESTRQARVRIAIDNRDRALRPGMFASAEMPSWLEGERLLAPRAAIIDTGRRQVAFVQADGGRFEPREVQIGVEGEEGLVEVRSGLNQGEMVVTSGQFLIDSESRLREALRAMTGAGRSKASASGATVPDAGPASPLDSAIDRIVDAYLRIADPLSHDALEGVRDAAGAMLEGVDAAHREARRDEAHAGLAQRLALVRDGAQAMVAEHDLESARHALASVSDALAPIVHSRGVSGRLGPIEAVHCPMYRADEGGSTWLQPAGKVRNPYMGAAMLGCYGERADVPPRGAPALPAEGTSP